MNNIIDLSKLPVSDGRQVINIIGLNHNGNVVRAENDTYSKTEIDGKLADVQGDLTAKQDVIDDLDRIRRGAEMGETALQKVPDEYITKVEVDEMLEDIEVDVDLTGYATEQWVEDKTYATEQWVENKTYATEQWVEDKTYATEQWVRQQGYVTDSDVNDYVGNEIGQLEEIINTKQDKLISGTNIKTINGNDILGEGDITIEGGDVDLSNYYTKAEIDGMIGDINNILETI